MDLPGIINITQTSRFSSSPETGAFPIHGQDMGMVILRFFFTYQTYQGC
jgi:hypothetical protein